MAYSDSDGGYCWMGEYVPFKRGIVLCDDCAETEIPLPPKTGEKSDGRRHHSTGFRWYPHYGADCTHCGAHA